jgi:hypothetical protein
MEVVCGDAVLRFYENITETTEEGDNPSTGWEFDRYTIKRPYDSGLRSRVESDVEAWLSLARQEEYTTLASQIRADRNRLLAATDRTQLPDAPEDKDIKNAYKSYRQALRDIPEQDGFPYNITFPEAPAA